MRRKYLPVVLVLFLVAPAWNSWSFTLHILVGIGLALWLAFKDEPAPGEWRP